jgi:signal peptidase I
MNDLENELLEDETEEIEIDQEEDFTAETLSVRKTLRFRMPIAIFALVIYYVLRAIDINRDFNPVNAPVFTGIGAVIFVVGAFIYFYDISTSSVEYRKKSVYKQFKTLNEIFDFLSVVPYLMLLITLVNMFFVSFSPISGTSMEPNYSDNEAVLFSHVKDEYERFDVVIVYEESLVDPYLIKRVIGLPGETVRILNNEVYINGVMIEQDFIDQNTINTYCIKGNDSNDCTFDVPSDSYFVLGDNRDGNGVTDQPSGYSIDSRSFGPVTVDNIYGKVVWKFKDNNLLN